MVCRRRQIRHHHQLILHPLFTLFSYPFLATSRVILRTSMSTLPRWDFASANAFSLLYIYIYLLQNLLYILSHLFFPLSFRKLLCTCCSTVFRFTQHTSTHTRTHPSHHITSLSLYTPHVCMHFQDFKRMHIYVHCMLRNNMSKMKGWKTQNAKLDQLFSLIVNTRHRG